MEITLSDFIDFIPKNRIGTRIRISLRSPFWYESLTAAKQDRSFQPFSELELSIQDH